MLQQVSQADGNIRNDTPIKSRARLQQATTVPQAIRHQTPNTFINVFIFGMPQCSLRSNLMWVFWKRYNFEQVKKKRFWTKAWGCSITLFLRTTVYIWKWCKSEVICFLLMIKFKNLNNFLNNIRRKKFHTPPPLPLDTFSLPPLWSLKKFYTPPPPRILCPTLIDTLWPLPYIHFIYIVTCVITVTL